MKSTELLRQEMQCRPLGCFAPYYFRSLGYSEAKHKSNPCLRADAVYSLFVQPTPHIYKNDWVAGSVRSLWVEIDEETQRQAEKVVENYPERTFWENVDHFSPDYKDVLQNGIPGFLEQIENSKKQHDDAVRLDFLEAMQITITGLKDRLLQHAEQCRKLVNCEGYSADRLSFIEQNCEWLAEHAPVSFAQALQLVWMIHSCFVFEGRYAMALGRIDQYLYPFFQRDLQNGKLTKEFATELIENTFLKIYELRAYLDYDDVVNICIGGMNISGGCDVNELSYIVLDAVRNCNVPGPNLSARISPNAPDDFLDACLKVIGTGIGYPALMNDTINIPALRRYGYLEEDIYNYSMVGCIENFISGKQPPWSDGRFDTPRFFEYLFNKGKSYDGTTAGLNTGDLSEITSMTEFMKKFEQQIANGAWEHLNYFYKHCCVDRPEDYTSPFLSCFCDACIERALDINMGGSRYPSIFGAVVMGIGTICDSLAAIEKNIFIDRAFSLETLRDAMIANFVGYEEIREKMLAAPKYGNNNDFVDKYAVWFVDFLAQEFDKYKTYDGGGIYIAMASNTSNIDAGKYIGATPDGRLFGEPLSDAASPTYGRDTRGATSTILSIAKPDYTKIACGTVLNQKFSPSMFEDGKREKLLQLIRVYFEKGGQEIQINATSTEILKDAMDHPEQYTDLVVRVSGFSAFYVTLSRDIQEDILHRTQQE